jgi:hypothetical protein
MQSRRSFLPLTVVSYISAEISRIDGIDLLTLVFCHSLTWTFMLPGISYAAHRTEQQVIRGYKEPYKPIMGISR